VHQAVWRLRRLIGESADSSFLVGKQRHGYALFPDAAPLPSRRSVAGF
jgi:DNA-binding SARP family transcriptional activator